MTRFFFISFGKLIACQQHNLAGLSMVPTLPTLTPCATICIQAGSLNLCVCTMKPSSMASAKDCGGRGNCAAPEPLLPGTKPVQSLHIHWESLCGHAVSLTE